jgi:hypothetical protein
MTKQRVSLTGVVTYWSSSDTRLKSLRDACDAVDPALTKYIPEASTPLNALRQALEQVFPGKLIRRLKGDGFAIVDEAKGETSNGYGDVGSAFFDDDAKGDDSADIRFRNVERDNEVAVRKAYSGTRDVLVAGKVGNILSRLVVEFLGGTILRPTGGIYWLPDDRSEKWSEIARAVENCGAGRGLSASRVYQLRHQMDAEAVRAVKDAIVHECETEASRINEQIMTGELGERALKSREREAKEMIEKVKRYEELLDVTLAGVRKSLGEVKNAAAAAAVLASTVESDEAEAQKQD